MERARPTRSGIPISVVSNDVRHDFQGHASKHGGHYPTGTDEGFTHYQSAIRKENPLHYPTGTDEGFTHYQSAIRKEKPLHFPARSQRKHNPNNNGRLENGHVSSHPSNDYDIPSRTRRSSSGCNSSAYGTSSGESLASRHRQSTRRPVASCSQIKRNYGAYGSQHEPVERSVIGCESPQAVSSVQTESGKWSGDGERATDVRQHEMCQTMSQDVGPSCVGNCQSNGKILNISGVVLDELVTRSSNADSNIRASNSEASTSTDYASGDTSTTPEAIEKRDCEDSSNISKDKRDDNKNKVASSLVDNFTSTNSSSLVVMDYPIRGTMHPLTSKVAIKRSVGPVDEVSFVFGRPASPSNEPAMNCSSPKTYTNPGIVRCMSPSPIRYISGRYPSRPTSPSSDILPNRRIMPATDVPGRRVLSPPPLLGLGAAAEPRIHHQGGICCEHCNGCLVELKRQALRLMFPDNGSGRHLAQNLGVDNIGDLLTMPEGYERWYSRTGQCGVCETPLGQLKQEAVSMIQSIQLAQTTAMSANLPSLVGSCSFLPQQRTRYNPRYGKPHSPYALSSEVLSPSSPFSSHSSMPLAAQAQAYLEQNVRAYINPQKYSQMLASRTSGNILHPAHQDLQHNYQGSPVSVSDTPRAPWTSCRPPSGQKHQQYYQKLQHHWPGYAHPVSATHTFEPHHVPLRSGTSGSPMSSPLSPPAVPSAAVSFFARAAQKLGKKKKRHHSQDQEPQPTFPTNFAEIIRLSPPPAPPCLLRTVGRLQNPGMGKVKVMLKICNPVGSQGEQGVSFLSADPRKKQVTVFDPSASGYVTSANRRTAAAAPKMFAFDSVVTPDDSLTELCAGSLAEIVQAVVAGADGCVFTYGYSKLGKTYTMIGSDHSSSTLGVMACAIAWLFKLINEQKDKTGARFSVRVSAVQVTGKEEVLRDLLSDIAQGAEATGVGTAPGVYLREDPICGTQLENQSELRAPTADKAAFYLDAALASRVTGDDDDAKASHLLFTLNVYQYRIEKANTKAGLPGVAGGRSRLHLIDLGTSSRSKDPSNVSLSLSALGNVIMALLNGQRHVPHRDSKIGQLLRDSLGNLSCRTCMIAHVSSAVPHYNETLQVIQLAARIHRMKRRRTKFSSTSSEDSSTDGDVKFRRPYRGLRMGTLREDILYTSSHSDPDYTSSSEQSCDTVIYIGANGQSLSDRELTDNEGPPRHVPRTNPRLPRRPSGSRSSGDDSDSGRSMRSVRSLDSRLSGQPLMSHMGSVAFSKLGHPSSVPGSPNPGLVKMGHIVGVYGKSAAENGGNNSSEQWQEKAAKVHSHSLQSKVSKAVYEKQRPLDGELWIDGPGASVSSEAKAELWVDGPQAFIVHQQPQSLTSSATSLRDGHQQPRHLSDSISRNGPTKKVDAEEQWVDGPREMLVGSTQSQPMHTYIKGDHSKSSSQPRTCLPSKLNEKALKQALVKHMDSITRHESDPSTSDYFTLQEMDSANFQNSDNLLDRSGSSRNKSECSNLVNSAKHVDASSSPMVSTKKQKLSESPKKSRSCTQSPKLSPSPSPSVSRKYNKIESQHASRLQKSQIPSSSPSPTHRVVQWIKSVSSEQELVAGLESRKQDSCGDQLLQGSDSVLMTDAETNTEHDSDFERLAEETLTKFEINEDAAIHSLSKAAKCESYKSSLDCHFDTAAMNRESIYEMEVERHLELIKTKDGSRLAAEVDNDTFSSVSCSNKDPDELDRDHCSSEMESLLIQHTKVLTESKKTSQLAHHLAQSYGPRNASPANCEGESEALDLSRPLLSRKPDGASNPNLHQIFKEEDSINKINSNCLPGQSLFVHACHNDSTTALHATSSKPYATLADDKNISDDIGMQSLYCREDFSKQPLLSNSSTIQKHSELPKDCTDCQTCTEPSPSCSIYCVAKPTHVTKDSVGNQQKQTLSGKKSYVPLSSPIRNTVASSDKASCSSSSTTHSPQSSATSSPLISTTSKSSTASPVQKASFKSRNGSVTKLPTICSSRTSSPSAKDGKSRKKEKEKGLSSHASLLSEIFHKGRGNDSDSGNDSGIMAHEKRLLSPYATVTKPRTASHSSSGHGSDNSTISTDVHPDNSRNCTLMENIHGGTSSGYESMMRDSEATGSSSGHDDSSSVSSAELKKGSKHKGKRSRSAPAHSVESSTVSSQPSQTGSKSAGHNHQVWVDTRHLNKVKDEPLELKRYDPDEVERLGRRRAEDEGKFSSDCKQKSNTQVEEDKGEPSSSHDRIELEQNSWSFDCRLFMCFSCRSQQRGTDV